MAFITGFMRKRVPLALLLAVFLTACSANPSASVTPGATPSQVSLATSTPLPQRGGTLRVPLPASPATWHPLFLQENGMVSFYSLLFEPLIALDSTRSPAASVADSWAFNQQGNLVLDIRRGINWHNGLGEVTGEDVVFTLTTILQNQNSLYYARLSQYAENAFINGEGKVEIKAKTPGFALVYALNIPVIPKAYYQNVAAQTTVLPRGSGPFEAVQNTAQGLALKANANWWKKQPYLEAILAVPFADNKAAIEAFRQGLLDCVPTDLLTTDVYTTFPGILSKEYRSRFYDFLSPNLKNGQLKVVEIRTALSLAIDRRTLAANVYLGHAITAESPVPSDSALNDLSVPHHDFSLAESAAVLQGQGYALNEQGIWQKGANTLSFTLIAVNRADQPLRRDTARELSRQLKRAGIALTVITLSEEEFSARLLEGNYDLALTGYYVSDVPDYAFAFSQNGAGNLNSFSDAALTQTMQDMRGASTPDAFYAAHSAFMTRLAEQVPQIGLFYRMHTLLYSSGLVPGEILRDNAEYESIAKWYFVP